MKHYIFTLLKDLPVVKAGFKIEVDEEEIKKNCRKWNSNLSNEFNEIADEVFSIKDNKDWVLQEFSSKDFIKIKCPKCDKLGMFKFKDNELEYKSDDDVDLWYENGGLECPYCNNKVYVYSSCKKQVVHW